MSVTDCSRKSRFCFNITELLRSKVKENCYRSSCLRMNSWIIQNTSDSYPTMKRIMKMQHLNIFHSSFWRNYQSFSSFRDWVRTHALYFDMSIHCKERTTAATDGITYWLREAWDTSIPTMMVGICVTKSISSV